MRFTSDSFERKSIRVFDLQTNSPIVCQSACENEPTCVSFSVVASHPPVVPSQDALHCELWGDATTVAVPCSTSFVQCSSFVLCTRLCFQRDRVCMGIPFSTFEDLYAPEQCQQKCRESSSCVWFHFSPKRQCTLFNTYSKRFCLNSPGSIGGSPLQC
eukprot:TRINITY_DN19505_c2_g1_i2.p2 TRINITY_DN19505_c2_g1~~TRINITY_DN19505_c2_g1_i2.p2  ORF type:complete len:158 (+),score=11.69 TRINITY_DN19505_c2_g1_i2:292-765(+)